jgi:DNA helicase-2/ATP-dependent DNA helicase PcrA
VQWLQDLNEAQKRAVTYGDGPLLVIAGAGTGKTRVLTYRIAYLLREKGVAPSHILAVTFTNKAAAEMKERLLQLVGPVAHQVWAGTFHSACVQILRRHAEMIGYSNRFSISDTSDQIAAVRQTLRELDMDAKKFDPRAVLSAISAAKNELLDAEDYADRAHDFWEQNVARVYPVYQQKLESSDSMDFDDLIMHTVSLFECHPDILELYRERLHYILVDEYQDTNHAQYRLVRLLAGENGNLCVVGDADQSIYRFRGADIRNILSFSTDYPTAKMVKLEKNYRSTRNILDAANHLISNNLDRPEKNLYTDNPEGDPVFVHQVGDGRDEAAFVADEIARWQRSGRSLNTVAILYRTHAQSRGFEEEFVKRNMPYHIVSGVRFYERREIKDILAYLRVMANPGDNLSLRRILNVPKRGLGDITQARLDDFAAREGVSLYEALGRAQEIERIGAATLNKVLDLRRLLDRLLLLREEQSLTELTTSILWESGYIQQLQAERTLESQGRLENLQEFLSVTKQAEEEQSSLHEDASEHDILLGFLEKVALISDVDAYEAASDAVTMMTLHAAKGLEFPVVFMVGMEEGVFPHSRALTESGEMEEERRLAYVGMTRAQERLYLTHANERMLYGQTKPMLVSPFVKEIPVELIRDLSKRPDRELAAAHERLRRAGLAQPVPARSRREKRASVSPGVSPSLFALGEHVLHKHFGQGTVVQVEASSNDVVVTVAFEGAGVKKLMASMAQLQKV